VNDTVAFVEQRRVAISKEVEGLAIQKDQRSAQQSYIFGMLPGLVIVGLIAAPLAIFTKIDVIAQIAGCAGSLGAVLSVLTRITRAQTANSLNIDFQVGRVLIFLAGMFRPVVGALLATGLYVLINGGLIPLKIPAQSRGEFFFAAIAFLAGFSERLAQDALVRTSRATFLGTGSDKPDL
jgi:hypothetical protein